MGQGNQNSSVHQQTVEFELNGGKLRAPENPQGNIHGQYVLLICNQGLIEREKFRDGPWRSWDTLLDTVKATTCQKPSMAIFQHVNSSTVYLKSSWPAQCRWFVPTSRSQIRFQVTKRMESWSRQFTSVFCFKHRTWSICIFNFFNAFCIVRYLTGSQNIAILRKNRAIEIEKYETTGLELALCSPWFRGSEESKTPNSPPLFIQRQGIHNYHDQLAFNCSSRLIRGMFSRNVQLEMKNSKGARTCSPKPLHTTVTPMRHTFYSWIEWQSFGIVSN